MRRKFIITLNVMIMAAMVIGNMMLLAPPAQAQEQVLLPMMAGSGPSTLQEIDLTLADDNVYEVRAGNAIPVGKAQGEFAAVTSYDDKLVPATTPLSVRLLASGVPVVNQAIAVKLQVHAYEAAPNTKAEIALPDGVELVDGTIKAQFDMAAGQTRSLKATIVFRETGEYDIAGTAKSVISVDDGTIYADEDHLYYTIGTEISQASAASGDNSQLQADVGPDVADEAAAADADADDDGLAAAFAAGYAEGMNEELALAADDRITNEDPQFNKEDPSAPVEEVEAPGEGELNAAATRTISFCWRLRHRSGSSRPFKDAYYKIYDQDGSVGGSDDDFKGSGYLSYYNGCASKAISDSDGSGTADVYVNVYLTHSGRYRIATNSGSTWWARSRTKWNITGNYNFGTLYLGTYGSTGNGRSLWLWEDSYWTRRTINQFRGGLGGDPGYTRIKWQNGSSDGTYYSRSNKWVHLKDADVKSPDTVVHELGHDIMDNLYSGWPISDCPSPHFVSGVSGKGCAWSEGWTYVITTLVNGDGVYTWPSGGTLNLETPHCTSAGWSDGPAVEGRVGGMLIDLVDGFVGVSVPQGGSYTGLSNETTGCLEDGTSGMFDIIWDAIYDQDDKVFVRQGGVSDSFSNAWESRQNPRYFPHRVGHHNTIPTFTHD